MSLHLNGLTVSELLEQLQSLLDSEEVQEDTPVVFSYNYGDHWRTRVAPQVNEVEIGYVTYSDYHQMPKVDDGDLEDNEHEAAGHKKVIILSR